MRTRTIARCCAVLALAAAAACADSLPSAPEPGPAGAPGPAGLQRVECVASRAEATVRCGAPATPGARGDLQLGGQGSYVRLTSSLVAYGGGQFTFYLSVQNLIGQAIGTRDGTTAASDGVRVFFADPPVVTSGTGAITVVPDGTGTFTAAGQPYYQYVQLLAPGATGFIKRWRLDMPATVSTFTFALYVNAPVRYPEGWVDVGAAARTVPRGGSVALAAVVRDRLGRAVAGEAVAYASSAPAVVAVDSLGNLSALALGTATITATSGARTGTVVVTSARPVATVLVFGGSVLVSNTLQLTTLLQDSSGGILSDRGVTYASSDTTRAPVSATGLVTALAAGPVTITATSEGKSGTATVTVATSPAGILQLTRVAAGANHTCALAAGGAAYCWGPNHDGQLGNGSNGGAAADFRNVPSAVSGGLSFASLVSGYYRSCGVTAAGAAYCWGSNVGGALGKGDTVHANLPTAVSGGIAWAMLAAGNRHTCGISTTGEAYCWGRNDVGQLGTGGTDDSTTPAAVAGGLRFVSISSAWEHTCAVTAAGAAYCWGNNYQGALGDGTATQRNAPVPVAGGLAFASVSAGMGYTCGVTMAGAGWCWGDNSFSQLGNGLATSANSSSVPVAISGGIAWAAIAAGPRPSTCGVATSGAAYCWGRNDGGATLGTGGGIGSSTVPARVAGGLSFASLSAGSIQTCGLTTGAGYAYCWGTASTGALGDGTYTGRAFPTPVVRGQVP